MGLVNGALVTGRNALLSYQSSLQIVGQNVANSGNADYARQSGRLTGVTGTRIGPGLLPGAGVTLSGLKRHVDEELENRLRDSIGQVESAKAERDVLGRSEVYFDDTSGAGISAKMVEFFNALSDVQNAPDDLATRTVALSSAESFATALRQTREDLAELGLNLNKEIASAVEEADRIAGDIADLNARITTVEAGGKAQANVLRDRRDALLRELGAFFDVAVREQPDGSINVYVGSEPLILNGSSRGLVTVNELDGEFNRITVRFADSNGEVKAAGGTIEGLIKGRDEHAFGRLQELDELAAGVIAAVNAVHADGQGLTAFTSLTSDFAVDDPTAPLNSAAAGLRHPPVNGSFYLTVTDSATGTPTAYRLDIDLNGAGDGTSLEDLVAAINGQVAGVRAEITTDNRLTLTADQGFSFSFGHDGEIFREDTAHVLAGLGLNTFFTGTSAADIAVRPELIEDPGLLAAATLNHVGDGLNAGRMAGLLNESNAALDGVSILDAYNVLANRVAAAGASADDRIEAADAVRGTLTAQRESISGVSLDEEAIDMLRFERAFQGAARYVSTVDQMLQEMIALAR